MLEPATSTRLARRGAVGSVVFISVFVLISSAGRASTLVHGVNRTCRDFADLDYALDHPRSAYFKGWMTEDFDAAESWVSSCVAAPPTKQDIERQSLLAQRRLALTAHGDIAANDKTLEEFHMRETREREEEERAQLAAQRQQEAAQREQVSRDLAESKAREARAAKESSDREAAQAAQEACLRSGEHLRFVAASHVLEALARESDAERALEHEKRVEEASETTDLYAKRGAGEMLVTAQDAVNRWFAEYRQYGGDAAAPGNIRPIENPCR